MLYRARYYSPQFGRFVSEDPVGFAVSPNLYQYAHGSPTNFFDPSGKAPDWNWWGTFTRNAVDLSPELGDGGCGKVFLEAFSDGGIVSGISKELEGSPDPWEVIDQVGGIAAAQYVVNQGLACPGCSSIYRNIGSYTETAAGWSFVLDVYTRIGEGAVAEVTAYRKHECQ